MTEKVVEKKTEVAVKELFHAKEVMPADRWNSLVEDCKEIIVEHVTKSREAVIECKWYLGQRLMEEGEEAITPLLKRVSVEIHLGERDLWRCLAFFKKFPRLSDLWEQAPEGKNISWHKLVNHYIDFTMPKPEIPVEEYADTFGLLKWWDEHPDLSTLRITAPDKDFTLVVRKEKGCVVLPERAAHLRDIYAEVGDYYIKLKKWDKEDLNRNDYGRMHRAIKELLEKAKYDKDKVKAAIKWCHDKYIGSQIDWGMETCVKKFAEAVRPVKDYEKYLKKDKL